MVFSFKVLLIFAICYSSCFALRGEVNVTNLVVQNDTIAVDVFDEVSAEGIKTQITCGLLDNAIQNYKDQHINDLKSTIDEAPFKKTVAIDTSSPEKIVFNNLTANHTYYLYCYSNKNIDNLKWIYDTEHEITTYLYKTPIPILTFLPPFTSQVIINVNPQILHGYTYCDKYDYGIPPRYPSWVDNVETHNETDIKVMMLKLAEIKINCDKLEVLDYNITYKSNALIEGTKYNLFCFGTNDGYYSGFYTANFSTKPGMPDDGMNPTAGSRSVTLKWKYPKNYNSSFYYKIVEFRIEIHNDTWNSTYNVTITDNTTLDFSYYIENLRPGSKYYYSIYAVNDNEDFPEDEESDVAFDTDIYRVGIPLSSSFTTQTSPPDKMILNITDIKARSANGSWEKPFDGGSAIKEYHIWISSVYTEDKESNYIVVSETQLYHIFEQLLPATEYYVAVRAVNQLDRGDWSDEISAFETLPDKPDPPTHPTIKWQDKNNLKFEWANGNNNGDSISNFTICPKVTRGETETSLTCENKLDIKNPSFLYQATNKLEVGDIVRYIVQATNDYGTSADSILSEPFYYDVPDDYIKSYLQCINNDAIKTEITVGFKRHEDKLNKPKITHYNIRYKANSIADIQTVTINYEEAVENIQYKVEGLNYGEDVIFYFSVCNDLGCNPEIQLECKTKPGTPDPPIFDLDRYYDILEHKINWTEPFHTGGLPIEEYLIFVYLGTSSDIPINTYNIKDFTELSYIITGLKKNTEYCYRMRSKNKDYYSVLSEKKCGKTAPSRPEPVIDPEYLIYTNNEPITLKITPEWNGGLINRTIKIYYKTTPYYGYFEYDKIDYDVNKELYELKIDLEKGKVYQIIVLAYNECPEEELNYGNKKLCGWSDFPPNILQVKTEATKPDRIREVYHIYNAAYTNGTVIFAEPDNNQANITHYTFYVCDYNNITDKDICEYNITYKIEVDKVFDYEDEIGFKYFNFDGLNNTQHKFALSSTNRIGDSLMSLESVEYKDKKRVTDKPESKITIESDIYNSCGIVKVEVTSYPVDANIFILFGKNTETNETQVITQNYTSSFEFDLSSVLLNGSYVFFVSSCNSIGCSDFSLSSDVMQCEIIPTTEPPTTAAPTTEEPTTTVEEIILIMPNMITISSINYDKDSSIIIEFNIPEFDPSTMSIASYSLYYYTNNNLQGKTALLANKNYTEVPNSVILNPVEYGIFYIFESYMENETERTISLYNISEIIATTPTKPTDLNVNNRILTWKNGNPRGSNLINNTVIIEPQTGYICENNNNNNNYEIVLLPTLLSYDLNCYVSSEYSITIYSTNSIGKSEISTINNYKPNIKLECNITDDSFTTVTAISSSITLNWNTNLCTDLYSYSKIRYKLYNTNQEYTEIETINKNYVINYLLPFTFYEIKLSFAYTISGVEFETDNVTKIVQTLSNSDTVNSLSSLPSITEIENGFRIQFSKPTNENYTIYVRINYTEGDANQIIEEIKNDQMTCKEIDFFQSICYYDYINTDQENGYMNWYEFGILSDENNNNNNNRILQNNNNDINFSQKYSLNSNFPIISYNPIVIQKDSDIISYPVINTTLYYRKIDNNNNNENENDKFIIDKKTGVITTTDKITEENGSFDIEYCYLTKCDKTTINYQIYDHLCYIEYNVNPLIFTMHQYKSFIPTITGGTPTSLSIVPNTLPTGIIFNNNNNNNNNNGEISGTYALDTPIVKYYNITCSTTGGNTFTPVTIVTYPNIDPIQPPPPSTSDENLINSYYNSNKNYLLLHYPLPILVDGFISNRTKISLEIRRYNDTLYLSLISSLTECPFSLTSQTSSIYLITSNNRNQMVKSINCKIENNQIVFDSFTVINGNGLQLPFTIESKKYTYIDPLPIYLTVWSNTSSVINKDTSTIPDDYIVGGNGSYCVNYVDGCGICEGIELSCLLRLKMNILLYNNTLLSGKDIYLFEKEINDKLNQILNEKYHNISTQCNIPSYLTTNIYYNFSLNCDIQRLDDKPNELVLSQIRYEIYKLIHDPYSVFYNNSNSSDEIYIYINDESTPSTETFIPIAGNNYCEIYEDKSNSRGDCNYTVDEVIITKIETVKDEGFPTWGWVLILILILLLLLLIILAIFLYYKHLNEVKRSRNIIQKSFAEIDKMKTLNSPVKTNNNNASSAALPIPSITEMRNRVNIIQGYVEMYINMKSWRRFYMVLVDAPYEILVYNSCQITSQGNVFVEIQEYIKLISIQNLECPAHGIKNNNNDIYGIPHYTTKSNNTFTFILRCKNILEKSKWLEVLNCIKSNNPIPSGLVGYGERSTVNPVGVNYAIQPIQSVGNNNNNNNQLVTIPNQNNDDILPNTYFMRSTVRSKDSDDSITTPRLRGSSLTNKRSLSNNQFLPPQIPPKIQPNKKYEVSNDTELPSYYHPNNHNKNRPVSSPPRRPEIRLPDASNDVLTTDEIVEYCLRTKNY